VPTPSIDDASSPSSSPRRDLRDRWYFRVAALVVALLVAGVVARGCGSAGRNISSEEAVEIARASTTFEPDKVQVRFLQQGIPPRPTWAVSLYNVNVAGNPTTALVIIVDATTGEIVGDD
jgi:hypothetical protein